MKKKRAERKPSPVPDKRQSAAGSAAERTVRFSKEPSEPIFAGISRSVGDLVRRTKGYFGSGKEAEA